jgi:hypothetical protein
MYSTRVEPGKIANRLLVDYAQEGQFEVRIDEADDLDLIAQRLKEDGCVVSNNVLKRTLDIIPPDDL